jgi:hypothetical protein
VLPPGDIGSYDACDARVFGLQLNSKVACEEVFSKLIERSSGKIANSIEISQRIEESAWHTIRVIALLR